MEIDLPRPQPAYRPALDIDAEAAARADVPAARRRSAPLWIGTALLLLVFSLAIFGPLLAAAPPQRIGAGAPLAAPSAAHWFGTDELGRDLFSRVVSGLRVSLWIGFAAATLTCVPGVLLGLAAGAWRGWLDSLLSRLMDVLLSLPGLLLAIVLIARLGPSVPTTIFALAVTGIPTFFRVTRAAALGVMRQPFIEASRALGMARLPLLLRHLLPNILGPVVVLCAMRVGILLLMASGLSFIGLGVQPPQVELGALLAAGKDYFGLAWWMIAFPGAAMLLAVMGLNLFGEGLRDRLV